jgi:hypothetical protein
LSGGAFDLRGATMTAQANSNWQARVRGLLRDGYGVEDIAVRLKCDVADVRAEVAILRADGQLAAIYGGRE